MANLTNVGGVEQMLPKKRRPELVKILDSSDVLDTVNALVEHVSLSSGHNKDVFEAAVTYKDLFDSGFKVGALKDGVSLIAPPSTIVDRPNLSIPAIVSGITISTTFNFALMFWTPAVYSNHAYVEIFRAVAWQDVGKTVPTNVGDATYLASSPTITYSDKLLPLDEMRYWFRNVSETGVKSPFSIGYVAVIPPKPSYLIDIISGSIQKSDLYVDLGTEITDATEGVHLIDLQLNAAGGTEARLAVTASLAEGNAGDISAAYTVKIDVGGYISGFGLMNSGSFSQFIIRADRFSISPPLGDPNDLLNFVPFIVDGANVLIKNAFIDVAYIESIVAVTIDADYVNTLNLNAITISGGSIVIGNDFSVDTSGVMYSKNAVIENAVIDTGTLKNFSVVDASNNILMSSSGVIQQAQVAGFDAGVTTLIDSAYIDALYSASVFAGNIYAANIEGDVTDLILKGSTSVTFGTSAVTILTFSVTALPFSRVLKVADIHAFIEHAVSGYIANNCALKKGASVVASVSTSAYIGTTGDAVITPFPPLAYTLASGESGSFSVTLSVASVGSGSHVAQSVSISAFKEGSTLA